MRRLSIEAYQVGVVCALPKEMMAVRAVLDEEDEPLEVQDPEDSNNYVFGRIHGSNVVIACLPAGSYGNNSAAIVAANMKRTFKLRFGLLVGIGGGIPNLAKDIDIRLGDIVVSQPDRIHGGVVQYDLGKNLSNGHFERKGFLDAPPTVLLTALSTIQSKPSLRDDVSKSLSIVTTKPDLIDQGYSFPGTDQDSLFCGYCDQSQSPIWWRIIWLLLLWINPLWSCQVCVGGKVRRSRTRDDPKIHYGIIASGNSLNKNAALRDRLGQELGAICIEMEAAGLMNNFPCLVIRGICDYADSHKNDSWQNYAAITAAAFAKELLLVVRPTRLDVMTRASSVVSPSSEKLKDQMRESLDFEGRLTRIATIEPREESTLVWMFDSSLKQSWDSLSLWLEDTSNHLYWIHGKPGSGKSTLMKALWEDERTSECLKKNSPLQNVHLLKHSFWLSTSNIMQKSFKGLLCSLMHEVLDLIDLNHSVQDFPHTTKIRRHNDWPEDLLEKVLVRSLQQLGTTSVICIFLDGLDEIEETPKLDKIRLRKFMKKASLENIKFCVSSRPEPPWSDDFQHAPQLKLEDLTTQDIEVFVSERLRDALPDDQSDPQSVPREQFLQEVVRKAEGMFIWVHLALSSILYQSKHATWSEIRERLAELPSGMNELYETIVAKRGKDLDAVKAEAAAYLRICIDSGLRARSLRRDVDGSMLHQALVVRHMYFRGNRPDSYEKGVSAYCKDYLQLEERITDICGGMLTTSYGGCLSQFPWEEGESGSHFIFSKWRSRGNHHTAPSKLVSVMLSLSHRTVADFLRDAPAGRAMIEHCQLSRLELIHAVVEGELTLLKFWPQDTGPLSVYVMLSLRLMMHGIRDFQLESEGTVTDDQIVEVLERIRTALSATARGGSSMSTVQSRADAADIRMFRIAQCYVGRHAVSTAFDIEGLSLECGIKSLFVVRFSRLLLQEDPASPIISREYKDYLLLCATRGNLPEVALQLLDSGADFHAEFFLPPHPHSKTSPAGQLLEVASCKIMPQGARELWAKVVAKAGSRSQYLLFTTTWNSTRLIQTSMSAIELSHVVFALDVDRHLRLWLLECLVGSGDSSNIYTSAIDRDEYIGFVILKEFRSRRLIVFPHTMNLWSSLGKHYGSGCFPHSLAPVCRRCLLDAGDTYWTHYTMLWSKPKVQHRYCALESQAQWTHSKSGSASSTAPDFEEDNASGEDGCTSEESDNIDEQDGNNIEEDSDASGEDGCVSGQDDHASEEGFDACEERSDAGEGESYASEEEARRLRNLLFKDLTYERGFWKHPQDPMVLQAPIPRFEERPTTY